jgi:fructan beta-fructosidase
MINCKIGFVKGAVVKKSLLMIVLLTFGYSCIAAARQDTVETTQGKTREFLLQKKYLNFPVKNGADKSLVHLIIDNKIVREFEIELAPDEPDFWVFLDVSDFAGKKAALWIDKYELANSKGFDSIYQADTYIGQENVYKEKLRPQFHFTSKRGWNNDAK